MSRIAEIVFQYFQEHPEARDGVMKAYYAYDEAHFRLIPLGHNFPTPQRWSRCVWCERSREEVRWDDLPPQCQQRPAILPDIEETIRQEEEKAFALQEKARRLIPRLKTIDYDWLWSTHGLDRDTVDSVLSSLRTE